VPVLESTDQSTIAPQQRTDAAAVLRALEDYCSTQQPGTRMPSRTEWMTNLNAPERTVRWALKELRQQGKIVGRRVQSSERASPLNGSHASPRRVVDESVSQKSNTVVAVTIPDHALFDQAMKMLSQQSEDAELSLTCHIVNSDNVPLASLPVMNQEPVGYVVFRRQLIPLAEQLHAAGHRAVVIGTPYKGVVPNVPLVYGNQEQGGYLATKHLIDLGHRRLAFCSYGDYKELPRWQGHQRAIREATRRGIDIEDCFLDLVLIDTWKEQPELGEAIFKSSVAPTGVAVWNDHEAVALMGQLNRLGLRVPDDVSIVGYDNLREGQLMHPSLTTVHSPMDEQIRAALNLLKDDTAPVSTYQLVIQPTLISRESSAPLKSGA